MSIRSGQKGTYFSSTQNGVPPPNSLNLLNAVAAGGAANQRIGTRVFNTSLEIRLKISPTNTNPAAIGTTLARIMVIYDRQPNGAAFATADLLQSLNIAAGTNNTVYAGLNLDNRERFQVLRNHLVLPPIGINGVAATTATAITKDANEMMYHTYIKLNQLETHYNKSTNNDIRDINTGALYLFTISDDAVYGNEAWIATATSRLRFYD